MEKNRRGESDKKKKNEEARRKGVVYKNEKRKGLRGIKRRIWAKKFVKHSIRRSKF